MKPNYVYFWIFGLLNNVLYVVILSAAFDIAGPSLPKTTILLADILPCFIIKIISPFISTSDSKNSFLNYKNRILALIISSISGMILVSRAKVNLTVAIIGICMASASSGFGETTFLQLTAAYGNTALQGWSSGTGMAGLFGSGFYLLLTSILNFSVNFSLILFSILPLGFLLYFKLPTTKTSSYTLLEEENMEEIEISDSVPTTFSKNTIINTLKKLQTLFIPYMLPLTTVYLFEYLINQAVSPTLLFPIDPDQKHLFFKKIQRYVYYIQCIISVRCVYCRSTSHLIRLRNLYLISTLQFINLNIAISQSWFFIFKSPFWILIFMFYQGFMGGASYVNTFLNIMDDITNKRDQEFALGATSIADALGILIAALIGLKLEPTLCNHQVNTGRNWCTLE
ncbi:hypothetical protein TBLA_0D05230 [Henningerozyma blattae CBS 6284]|uniref:Protein BTN n=1 Tax=Henningerozyma blattae (strain ATCC 34711 / CBS 6284 / DSM 70876 / NBRC 10599 / NRRL Y-10934 / UCD 77-7) TaxID=1071380 RepID=I2H3R4_HENB6|nr:hypothetical protein TBLA_0D05230 [Tetrapisispora blattae CBS 6284]CCH61016.1 hypothetical protein TBLA_0D05230 [Tetrapisispora blattae CBS 6284]